MSKTRNFLFGNNENVKIDFPQGFTFSELVEGLKMLFKLSSVKGIVKQGKEDTELISIGSFEEDTNYIVLGDINVFQAMNHSDPRQYHLKNGYLVEGWDFTGRNFNVSETVANTILTKGLYPPKPDVIQSTNRNENILRPYVKKVLQDILGGLTYNQQQRLWEEKVPGQKKSGLLYPDLASVPLNSQLADTDHPDFSQFRLLFEVEPQITSRGNKKGETFLISAGKRGISQWIQWLYLESNQKFSVKYGAVTDYDYWVILCGVKKDNHWMIYESKQSSLLKNEKTSFDTLKCLCELFIMENESFLNQK